MNEVKKKGGGLRIQNKGSITHMPKLSEKVYGLVGVYWSFGM